jgi:hypothetical protein
MSGVPRRRGTWRPVVVIWQGRHGAQDYIVEVDIVMPSETPLWKAHDLSQDLQDKLETLPRVDRAFGARDCSQPAHR